MSIEPRKFGSSPTNTYVGRWVWWYSAIADWMIRNPGRPMRDCAAELGKHPNTISMIANTDMFREYLAQRKAEWRDHHDFAILSKVTAVAENSLDLLLEKMEKKRDQIPMQLVNEVATGALDRLGYAPKRTPDNAVNVNVNTADNRVQVAVDASALAEARDAMRLAEQRRALDSRSEASAPQIENAESQKVVEASDNSDEVTNGGNPVEVENDPSLPLAAE